VRPREYALALLIDFVAAKTVTHLKLNDSGLLDRYAAPGNEGVYDVAAETA
jgi:hypothetical protein